MTTGRTITLPVPAPPASTTFAAVQLEATTDGEAWRIVGAEPARDERGELKREVRAAAYLEPDDVRVRAVWVCEDASLAHVVTEHALDGGAPRRARRLGGPRS